MAVFLWLSSTFLPTSQCCPRLAHTPSTPPSSWLRLRVTPLEVTPPQVTPVFGSVAPEYDRIELLKGRRDPVRVQPTEPILLLYATPPSQLGTLNVSGVRPISTFHVSFFQPAAIIVPLADCERSSQPEKSGPVVPLRLTATPQVP